MQELRGLLVAKKMAEQATALVEELKGKGVMPKLAVVRVGEREDDLSYERGLMKKFENVERAKPKISRRKEIIKIERQSMK